MQANPKHPPFGEVRRIACERCGRVSREWWHAGYEPFEAVAPERHKLPVPEACPKCGGPLGESLILLDGGPSLSDLLEDGDR